VIHDASGRTHHSQRYGEFSKAATNLLAPRDNDHMLRDKNLIPLSHQHQHALAMCVRIDRAVQAAGLDLPAWQAEVHQIFEQEIRIHFEAEEQVLFPAAVRLGLEPLVQELLQEHAILRESFSRAAAQIMDISELHLFATKLSAHIRKEERQLFEAMQRLISPEQMQEIGAALEKELATASNACILPNDSTRLRSKAELKKL
jgi:hemerythrin-like domain-containing protein